MLSSVVRVQSDPIWNEVCTQEPIRSMPFCNVSLALEERVNDYVHRIPTIDKIFMMGHVAMGYEPLLIPPYQWWSEGLHGPLEPCVSFEDTCACPTSFPCPSALGAAFNATLYHAIGVAIGKEGRAISNLRTHDLSVGDGLTYWSPTINLQRDPRWGRNQEGKDIIIYRFPTYRWLSHDRFANCFSPRRRSLLDESVCYGFCTGPPRKGTDLQRGCRGSLQALCSQFVGGEKGKSRQSTQFRCPRFGGRFERLLLATLPCVYPTCHGHHVFV